MTTEPRSDGRSVDDVFRQLCHLISLYGSDKVQGAVEGLVLTAMAIDPSVGGGDPNEVATAISAYFGIQLPVGSVRAVLEGHLRAGRLVVVQSDGSKRVALAAGCRAEQAGRVQEAAGLEADVREQWLAQVHSAGVDLDRDKLWASLQQYLGARA